jgi:hypothetical protein
MRRQPRGDSSLDHSRVINRSQQCCATAVAPRQGKRKTPQPEKQTMWQRRSRALAKFVALRGIAPCVILMPLAGCGSSTAVSEIPEQSRKAIIQRKVDVTAGKAKSSRTGAPPAKGRPSER